MITKNEIKFFLIDAYHQNTLLIPKHNPYNIATPWNKYRTVVSHEVTDRLFEFIDVGMCKVFQYTNKNPLHSAHYYEIVPDSSFNIVSSGITGGSTVPQSKLDRIIAVSGQNQDWHIFGEDSNVIVQKLTNGQLTDKTELF